MVNPSMLMNIMNAKNVFEGNHPKFTAMIRAIISENMLEEGSVIEMTVTKPDGTKVEGNLKVTASDIEQIQKLQNMK